MMQKQSTGFEIKTDWYKNRRHKNKEGTKRNNKRKHVTNVTMLIYNIWKRLKVLISIQMFQILSI